MRKGELDQLKNEEKLDSDTDLTKIRQEWYQKYPDAKPSEGDAALDKAQPIRNHGLFSKAERALTYAGWSEKARRDIEIFRLVDVEGLTPILMVLNENAPAEIEKAEGSPAPA
jgi:hypothetical protein